MEDIKFNYIIIGSDGYYLAGYHDLLDKPYVSYHQSYNDGFDGFIPKQLLRWNFSRQLNKYIHTPFSWYVYPRLYPHYFNDGKPLCFLFFGNQQYIYQTSYLEYIRKTHPSAKIVLYMQDVVRKNKELNFEKVAGKFDLLLSYDKGDAAQYSMLFHPTPMSKQTIEEDSSIVESDVYFCGYAKTRYPIINDTYMKCKEAGLRCDFIVLDMPNDAEHVEGIQYLSKPLTYIQNLQHVQKTKCVVEIMQEGADGYTPRLWESIIYDKHLLTNNKELKASEFCYEQGQHSIESLTGESISELIISPISYPEPLKDKLSPVHLLQFIDRKLQGLC